MYIEISLFWYLRTIANTLSITRNYRHLMLGSVAQEALYYVSHTSMFLHIFVCSIVLYERFFVPPVTGICTFASPWLGLHSLQVALLYQLFWYMARSWCASY